MAIRIAIPKEVSPWRAARGGDARHRAESSSRWASMFLSRRALARSPTTPTRPSRLAGASIAPDTDSLWESADVLCKINPPQLRSDGSHEADSLRDGSTLISLIFPGQNAELVERLQQGSKTAIALDKIPRITRAQKMDVLSSMANIAGYRAVLEAAHLYGGFFSGQITAAGKTRPAQVLVIGAGVAGLAAIGTARSLGAEVRAFDVRPDYEGAGREHGRAVPHARRPHGRVR